MPYLALSDGSYMQTPEGMSEEDATKLAQQKYPELFPGYAEHEAKTGAVSAFTSALKSGAGSALEGVGNLAGIDALAKSGKAMQDQAAQSHEATTQQDIDVAGRKGIMSLLSAELRKNITEPIAGAAGSIAGRYGVPIVAGGAAALAAPETAIAGALGFAAANAPIHIGENISAQKAQGQKPDYAKATAFGIAQTAVDSLGGEIVGGAMKGFALKTATQEASLLAPKVLSGEMTAAEASASISGKLNSVLKGTAEAGVAGTGMMVGNEALTRAASGQDVFSPEAIDIYKQQAKDMGMLAPFLGLLHAGQPAKAKAIIDEARSKGVVQREGIAREQQAENAQIMAEHYASPEGQAGLAAERGPVIQQLQDIQSVLKQKGLSKDDKQSAKNQVKELTDKLNEINSRVGVVQQVVTEKGETPKTFQERLDEHRAQREAQEKQAAELAQNTQFQLGQNVEGPLPKNAPDTRTVAEKERDAEVAKQVPDHEAAQAEARKAELQKSIPTMKDALDKVETSLNEAFASGNTGAYKELAPKLQEMQAKHDAAVEELKQLSPEDKTAAEKAQLEKEIAEHEAEFKGTQVASLDPDRMNKLVDQIEQKKQRLFELQTPEQGELALEPKPPEPAKPAEPKYKVVGEKEELEDRDAWAKAEAEALANENLTPEQVQARMKEIRDKRLADQARLEGYGLPGAEVKERIDQVNRERELMASEEHDAIKDKRIEAEEVLAAHKERKVPEKGMQAKMHTAKTQMFEKVVADAKRAEEKALAKYEAAVKRRKAQPKKRILDTEEKKVQREVDLENQRILNEEYTKAAAKKKQNKGKLAVRDAKKELGGRQKEILAELTRLGKEHDKALKEDMPKRAQKLWEEGAVLNDELMDIENKIREAGSRKNTLGEKIEALGSNARIADEVSKREKGPAIRKVRPIKMFEEGVHASKEKRDAANKRMEADALEAERRAKYWDDDGNTVYRIDEETGKERVEMVDARKAVDEFNSKLGPDVPKVVYADRFDDLSPENKAKFEGVEEDARRMKGAVTPDGTMLVIGEHHPDLLDVQRTLAHEAFGHYGFDRLVGKKGLFDLANKIEQTPEGILGMAKKLGPEVYNETVRAIGDARRQGLPEQVQKVQALREMVAHLEQGRLDEGMLKRAGRFVKEMVGAIKQWMRDNGLGKYAESTTDSDILYMLRKSRDAMAGRGELKGEGFKQTAFRKEAKPTDSNDPRAVLANAMIGKKAGLVDAAKKNISAFNTQFVDRLAPLKEIWRRMGESGPTSQMIYHLLAHGQRTNIVSETVTNGARKFIRDPITGEITIGASGGPGMKQVLQELLQSKAGNSEALNEMFTAYAAAKRAEVVGYKKLVADGELDGSKVTPEMLDAAKKAGDADPAFVKAFDTYQKYNSGLMDSLAQSGYISQERADFYKNKNYIPYYRVRGGNAELIIGNEMPIRIGSLKDQPYLHELAGGDNKILDFFTSAVKNTNMITEMALRNNATSSVARTLQDLGIAEIRKGSGEKAPNVVRFKSNGKDYHAVIDTAGNAMFNDISPDLLVKGMEGVPTQLPGIVRLMGVPANWLRKGVTRNPFYAYKQLVRDPISAWLTTGGNFTPVISSLKEVGEAFKGGSETFKRLQESGILGGEVYTGRAEDLRQIVTRLEGGKANLTGVMAFMDKVASEADASTRSVLYDSFRKQGLSDMEAQIATMESMNFNTRGASPSMHWVNTMVPFFNSAIQGYNVMYKAFNGKMPFAKRLDIQNKLIKRGSMIAGMSVLYAIAQQDNDAYKNATPEQRYLNWLVPGVGKDGKEAFRLPIPFEAGYIFKAFPEALINMAYADDMAREGLDAIKTVLNATNPLGVPTAIKAPIELAMNRSLYTGQDIESERLQKLEPGQRAYDSTNEVAKQLGEMLGISPVKLDYLAKNYLGGMYTTVSALVNPMIADPSKIKPDGSMADLPAFGQMFQPQDAGGITERAYTMLSQTAQKAETFKAIAEKGDVAKAQEYAKENQAEIGIGNAAASMKSKLDSLSSSIRKVKEQTLPPSADPQQFAIQKRQQLDALTKARSDLATAYTKTIAETKRQSSR